MLIRNFLPVLIVGWVGFAFGYNKSDYGLFSRYYHLFKQRGNSKVYDYLVTVDAKIVQLKLRI
jgi:hypothetical protein